MKFYAFVLFGVLCALSSMTHAEDTWRQTDKVIKRVVCPAGKRAVELRLCPEGVLELENCWKITKVKCVENAQVTSEPREKVATTTVPVPNTWKEYDIIKGATCPPGKKAVQEYTCRRNSYTRRECYMVESFACVPDDEVNSHLGPSNELPPYGRGSSTFTFVDDSGKALEIGTRDR